MIYEAECVDCGKIHEYVRPISHYLDTPPCPVCGGESRKVIRTAPYGAVMGKFEPYKSQVDGTIIRTQEDLRRHNERNGVVLLNDGYSEEDIAAGKVGQAPVPAIKREEIIQDMQEAIHDVQNGYKPQKIEAEITTDLGWSNVEVPDGN
jgi:hypothetical protein